MPARARKMRRSKCGETKLEAFWPQKRDEEIDAERNGDDKTKDRLEHAGPPQTFFSE
jgi:hypothetical protein